MAYATSPSKAGVFWDGVKRNWPVMALYALILIICLPVLLMLLMGGRSVPLTLKEKTDIMGGLLDTMSFGPAGALLAAAMAFTAAYVGFSHLNTMRGAQFFLSLPVKRGRLFLEKLASGVILMLAPVLLAAVAAIPAAAVNGCLTADTLFMLLKYVGKAAYAHMLFYALSTVCALVSGNALAGACFYVVVNFIVSFILGFTGELAEGAVYGLETFGDMGVMRLSPLVYLMSYSRFEVLPLLLYGALTLLLLAAGYAIYNRRRAEAAGDVVALLPLKPVFKYGVAVCLALLMNSILGSIISRGMNEYHFGWTLLFMLAFGVIGYIAADMLNRRSIRIPAKGFIGLAAYGGAAVLALVALFFMPFGFVEYRPAFDEIEYVQVGTMFNYTDGVIFNDAGLPPNALSSAESKETVLALHKYVIDNRDAMRYTPEPDRYVSENLTIRYMLSDGHAPQRKYRLRIDDPGYLEAMEGLLNSEEYMRNRFEFPEALDVSVESCRLLTYGKSMLMIPATTDGTGAVTIETELSVAVPVPAAVDSIVLGTSDARRLFDAVMRDLEAGRIGRFSPSVVQDAMPLTLSFDAAIAPKEGISAEEAEFYSRIRSASYRIDITQDATETNAMLNALLGESPAYAASEPDADKYGWVFRYNNQGISYR